MGIEVEDFYYVGIVTIVACMQMIIHGVKVGKGRKTYNVPAPKTSGNDTWERMFRAQQNGVEWFPVFMALLWAGALFGCHIPSSILGGIYIIGRQLYYHGYVAGGDKRGTGFKILFFALMLLLLYNIYKVGRGVMHKHF